MLWVIFKLTEAINNLAIISNPRSLPITISILEHFLCRDNLCFWNIFNKYTKKLKPTEKEGIHIEIIYNKYFLGEKCNATRTFLI